MSRITCSNIIEELNKSIDKTNYQLLDNMTNPDMRYEWVCVKPDISYVFFYETLKRWWEKIFNEFIKQSDHCSTGLSGFLNLYKNATPEKI